MGLFKKKAQTKIGDRVISGDNFIGESSLLDPNTFATLLNQDNVKVSSDLLVLHRQNYLMQEIVSKLTNDLSNIEIYQEDNANAQLVEYINKREFRMMIKEAWYNYLFKGYFILGKSVRALGSDDIRMEVITLESSILNGIYTNGRLTGIRINAMKIDTDEAGMSSELMIYGNREYASNKVIYNAPLESVKEQIRTIEFGRGYLQSVFSRGAIAPVILTLRPGENPPTPAQEESIMDRLKKALTRKDSPANIIPVTGFDINNISADTKNTAIIDAIKKAEESALLGMGISAEILGLNPTQSAMRTRTDAIQSYYATTIIPQVEMFLGALSMWLNKYSRYSNVDLAVDMTKLPFTKDKDIENLTKAAGALQVLTRNEVRKMFGYDELTDEEMGEVNEDKETGNGNGE